MLSAQISLKGKFSGCFFLLFLQFPGGATGHENLNLFFFFSSSLERGQPILPSPNLAIFSFLAPSLLLLSSPLRDKKSSSSLPLLSSSPCQWQCHLLSSLFLLDFFFSPLASRPLSRSELRGPRLEIYCSFLLMFLVALRSCSVTTDDLETYQKSVPHSSHRSLISLLEENLGVTAV